MANNAGEGEAHNASEMVVILPPEIVNEMVNNPNQNPNVIIVQQPINQNVNQNVNQNANPNQQSNCCWVAIMVVTIAGLIIGLLFWWVSTWEFWDNPCFDAQSIVKVKQLDDHILDIPLADIKIGDYVLTLNPETNELFWDQILMRVHYGWYDQKDSLAPMRTIHLENNISSITLSYDHFLFINDYDNNKSKVIPSKDIQIGDTLFYFDENKNQTSLIAVSGIDENVMKRYRVIFGLSQYILVNNIVASPFVGPHPIYHDISYKMLTTERFIILRYISCPLISSFVIQHVAHLIFATYWIYSHPVELCIVIIAAYYFIYNVKCKFRIGQKQKSE